MSNRRHPQGVVALRRQGNTKDRYVTLCLTVPQPFSHEIAHLEGHLFSCELTEDGLLFRHVQGNESAVGVELPTWAQNGKSA